jgi:hypothetical protein
VLVLQNATLLTPWPLSASKLYRPSGSRLSAKLVPTSAERVPTMVILHHYVNFHKNHTHFRIIVHMHGVEEYFLLGYYNAVKPAWQYVEAEVNLRPTVSRPFCLGVRHPPGTRDQLFFPLEISFRQLRVYYFVAPSLTRGRVCNLLYNYFWALPEQSLLGRSPAELTTIFYCLISDSPNLEGQVPLWWAEICLFFNPENGADMFLENIAWLSTEYTALNPEGQYS